MQINDSVVHEQYGKGQIISLIPGGSSVVVRFEGVNDVKVVAVDELSAISSIADQIKDGSEEGRVSGLANIQAKVISYVNDTWGLFSRSSIRLLPHQLWVCKQVLRKWPVNYIVADDVGLGKTVEAGLIMCSLKNSKNASRILVLTPAKLTVQWQERMSEMFNLNFDVFSSGQGNSKVNYWDTHDHVIASFPTVQLGYNDLHDKLLNAKPWDLVVVDEAHHMYADENGETQKFNIFKRLKENGNVTSAILFTGTPHRGKNYGFWSLMSLLDSEKFGPDKDPDEQFALLGEYFIRNNKKNVVSMDGKPLFTKMTQYPEEYCYSPEEKAFYARMEKFICDGEMYAKSLSNGSANGLLLTALQKIASSSTAAISTALENRKKKLLGEKDSNEKALCVDEQYDDELIDQMKLITQANVSLMENEISHIDELLELAGKIKEESRVKKIISIIKDRYPNDQVLLFTEYKRTQALMLSALMAEWGSDSVTFINGDEALDNVKFPDGSLQLMSIERIAACKMFNEGKKKFLVSTEAAGEGIDLQKKCHVLIHIDLPWNPMRIHQRIGRVHRLGQTENVDVISVRCTDNLESKIWDCLNVKLDEIQRVLSSSMEDPDDIMQIVLGMQTSQFYENMMAKGMRGNQQWFDSATKTFGGDNVLDVAKKIGLNAAKFDLAGLDGIPKLDLADLIPFFRNVIKLNGHGLYQEEDADSYRTVVPNEWILNSSGKKAYGARSRENGLLFRRNLSEGENPKQIVGIGHYLMNRAIKDALGYEREMVRVSGTKSYFLYSVIEGTTTNQELHNQSLYVICYDSVNKEASEESIDEFYKFLEEVKEPKDCEADFLAEVPSVVQENAEKIMASLEQFKHPVLKLCGAAIASV